MKKMARLPVPALLLTILVITNAPLVWSQNASRNIKVIVNTADGKPMPLYNASFALVVGVADYTNGWPDLTEAVNDARQVKAVLEQQGFVVTLVENPTAAQLEGAIKRFIASRGINPENRLLFYFAGHGHTLKKGYGGEMGYIIPSDAPLPEKDPGGFSEKAISMENFNTYARDIDAKHVLFIFDSCFSGSIFALSRAVPAAITYKTREPVRQFITAGSADETVPDKSIFKQQFLAAIKGEADKNQDNYVTGAELGEFLQTQVINYSRESQHPQYGKIRDPQLDKGDFVFVVPVVAPPAPKFDPTQYEAEASRAANQSQWDTWQKGMNAGYQKAQGLDGDANLAAASKVRMWQDFLQSYAADNPYSQEDERLRREASQRQSYWSAYKPPSTTSQPPTVQPTRAAPAGMVLIPAGSFMMGSTDGESDEKPVHEVYVDAFYMDQYEVTVAQYQRFLNANSRNQPVNWNKQLQAPNRPVVNVSWDDANAYATWARKKLPTEAQWEYAARGGFTGVGGKASYKYSWGNDADATKANYSGGSLKDVGSYSPNGYGLYDMGGNAWEWCADWYGEDYYQKSPKQNPTGPTTGTLRVLRGGSWDDHPDGIRCALRLRDYPMIRFFHTGFRCVQDGR